MKKLAILVLFSSIFLIACAHQETPRVLSSVVDRGSFSQVFGRWSEIDLRAEDKNYPVDQDGAIVFISAEAIRIKNENFDCRDVNYHVEHGKGGYVRVNSLKCERTFVFVPTKQYEGIPNKDKKRVGELILVSDTPGMPGMFMQTAWIK